MNVIAAKEITQEGIDAPARNPIEVARTWLDEHGKAALATVVSTWGSAPVPVGGQLVVGPDERFQGSVSGGCVEGDVIAEAADVMAGGRPKLMEFGVAEETAWRAGLPCGGTIKVLLEPLARARDAGHLDHLLKAQRERKPLVVTTNVITGTRHIFEPAPELPAEIAASLASGQSHLLETPESNVFVQALLPPVRLIIAGGTNIGQVLAELAREVGYDVIVVDPRAAFVTEERFGATSSRSEWPEVSLTALGLDSRTAVVALTHAAHIDDEALSVALRSTCLYIGALGSKTTHAKRLERLKAAGFSSASLKRIHAPIGLAIGAKGPAEIAVSILAEIIKVARGAA
jgi:xanthine dehydrogenase accessory factor